MAPPPKKPMDVSAANKTQNEYIPNFISKKPFYVVEDEETSAADYLEHQRLQKSTQELEALKAQRWYDRGRKLGPAATKYRKGACENCGAMTHKTKDCLSRPRKHGAKWTGRDIQADEVVQDVNLGWDAKRDRWNGYNASQYDNVIEEYNALEELKKNEAKINQKSIANVHADGDDDTAMDEGDKYEEETDMGRQQATSTKQLRLREDTAKYLLNLDLDSAKYDPKTRSMVDSGATADQAAALVAEEGFMKASGDAAEFEKATRYAWEMQERGDKNKIHLQANPTSGEYFRKKEQQRAEAKRDAQRKLLLDKYGSQATSKTDTSKDVAIVESEKFVEYDEHGGVKGVIKSKAKSQYVEDVLINNHTSVWGTWWKDFQWGYLCCHSTVKNSYCTGEAGKQAEQETNRLTLEAETADVPQEVARQIAWQEEATNEKHVPNGVEHDGEAQEDTKVRKRKIGSMRSDLEDEELEVYRRTRVNDNDPMAKHLGRDELLA